VTSDVLPTLLGIALVAAAAAFALLPFVRGASEPNAAVAAAEPESTDRGQIYRQVLELDFDRQLGKLSEDDYRQLSAGLLARAGELLREERGTLGELDEEIEREIAAARAAFAAARRSRPRRAKKRTAEPVP
jgi:hypothetical protein